ncbi:MAG: QsdR family transcriptional regulator [Mycobacteriales bacterium]
MASSVSTLQDGDEPAGEDRPLTRQLREGRPTVALDAFRLARRRFQSGERIEMHALAAELGINRVTLYRWVGSREQLLVEVIWSLTAPTLERDLALVPGTGGERIAYALTRFIQETLDHIGMRRYLEEEGELAMRLLTSRQTGYQPRLINKIEEMLRQESDAGSLRVPVDLHELAFVLVRLVESYVYTDYITGERPDPKRAEPILLFLLRNEPSAGHVAATGGPAKP